MVGSGARWNRVVITGMGVVSPLGSSVESFWSGLLNGDSGVVALTEFDLSKCRSRIGARVRGYDPVDHFTNRELRRLNLTSQFALVAADQAFADAMLDGDDRSRSCVGVIIGSAAGGSVEVESIVRSFLDEGIVSNPLSVPLAMNNAPASNVSIRFGCHGPLMTVDAACASSAHAIGYAFNLIRSGLARIIVTGGADTPFSPTILHAWSSLRALSERNETPAQACRPFSQDRDGIVLGEGAGILVLESEESALSRGARILAEVSGYAATSDAHHLTQPSLEGIRESMRLALLDADLPAEEISYINAHGTATQWNDKTETAAIKEVFGSHARDVPVVSIKGSIGHSMGASGALELISCVLSIRDSVVPPTINLNVPDPECDLDYVADGARSLPIAHAMSNSFAFGGSNGVLIVSRYAR